MRNGKGPLGYCWWCSAEALDDGKSLLGILPVVYQKTTGAEVVGCEKWKEYARRLLGRKLFDMRNGKGPLYVEVRLSRI